MTALTIAAGVIVAGNLFVLSLCSAAARDERTARLFDGNRRPIDNQQ